MTVVVGHRICLVFNFLKLEVSQNIKRIFFSWGGNLFGQQIPLHRGRDLFRCDRIVTAKAKTADNEFASGIRSEINLRNRNKLTFSQSSLKTNLKENSKGLL